MRERERERERIITNRVKMVPTCRLRISMGVRIKFNDFFFKIKYFFFSNKGHNFVPTHLVTNLLRVKKISQLVDMIR